jgi:hypothetical protein
MHGQSFKFGGGAAETMLHPAVAAALILAALLVLVLPRKYIIAPLLAAAFLIPSSQVIVVGSAHFGMLRVLIFVAWIRVLGAKFFSRTKIFSGGVNTLDKIFISLAVFTAIDFVLLWLDTGALLNQLGVMYSVLGVYFLLRFLIRDEEDVIRATHVFACLAVVIAGLMVTEQVTGRSPYAFIGLGSGLKSLIERGDHPRSMAAFAHPILAGTFGAVLMPLFIAIWLKHKKSGSIMLIGIAASIVITIASYSSTPVLVVFAALIGFAMWPLRNGMQWVRRGIALVLLGLHLVMKAPVWALIQRMDLIGGSSGYHRYMLVDLFIRRFGDWWMLGVRDNTTWGWDMWDLANQYVSIGEGAGIIPFVLFIALLVYGFKFLGRARKAPATDRQSERFYWAMSVTLFGFCVAFFGIDLFDQTLVVWYAFLAMISATAGVLLNTAPAMVAEEAASGPIAPRQVYLAIPAAETAKTRLLPSLRNRFDQPALLTNRKKSD